MYTVKLMRQRDEREEEYGRILFDGKTVKYQGLTRIFQAYLKRGIEDKQHHTFTPKDGLSFLRNLKNHCFDPGLYATDVSEIS